MFDPLLTLYPPFKEDSSAKGWDVIQEKVRNHDEDMIGDFADDVDTLLVFVSIVALNVHLADFDTSPVF